MESASIRILSKHKTLFLGFFTAVSLTSFSSNSIAQSKQQAQQIEEIVVTSQRSLRAMRLEMENAEQAVFDVFNQKYTGTDFEMICVREKPTKYEYDPIANSFGVRVCRSRMSHNLRKKQLQDFTEMVAAEQEGYVGVPVDIDYYAATAREYDKELLGKVSELIQENPEYGEALSSYNDAKSSYEAAKKADMESGNFITRLFKRDD